MGNTASTDGRRRSRQGDSPETHGVSIIQPSVYFEEPAMMDYAGYQQTLHQYLSQRYAHRYTNRQRTYQQQQTHQAHQAHQTHQTQNAPPTKTPRARLSSVGEQSAETIALVLKRQSLAEVPLEVCTQTEITSLDLSSNELKELPREIGNLHRLTRLALGGNQLVTLPNEIAALQELTWLDFTHNRISFLPASFAELKKLNSLGASECRLAVFPESICELSNLRKLGLFNNMFAALPPSIGNLQSLTKLDLSGNALARLPVEIGQLTELTWLNLSHNRLEEIPDELGQLTKLKELGLAHNRLKRLPNLSQLTQLTLLPVYNNELEELDDWIGSMPELNKLDVSCNNLTTVPASILLPRGLTFLNLRKNCLKTLPDRIFDERIGSMVQTPLPLNLVTVDVRENQLEYLPVGLIGPALVELKTGSNSWILREQHQLATHRKLAERMPEMPSLLDLVCTQVAQNEPQQVLFARAPRAIQMHVLQRSRRCQQCERLFVHDGIDCFVWRATTDSPEVPFRANVCRMSCLRQLDGHVL